MPEPRRLETAALAVLGVGEVAAVIVGGTLGVLSAVVWAPPAWIGWRRPTVGGLLLVAVSVCFALVLLAFSLVFEVSVWGAVAVLVVFCVVPLVAGVLLILAAARFG